MLPMSRVKSGWTTIRVDGSVSKSLKLFESNSMAKVSESVLLPDVN